MTPVPRRAAGGHRPGDRRPVRAAAAGAAAAAAWALVDEPANRLFRSTPYSDARLLGGFVTRGPWQRPLGVGLHVVNGAAFGLAFERVGGRGVRQALVAAGIETVATWPLLAAIDRVHPDRRSGRLPPLASNGRLFAEQVAVHALFGLVLGVLTRR